MTTQLQTSIQRTSSLLYAFWARLCGFLQTMGLLPQPPTPEALDLLETAMEHSFRPVEPSQSFKASLRDNLQVAIQHQADGMVIEYPYLLRYRLVLGVSAGILAAAVAGLVFIFRPRPKETRH